MSDTHIIAEARTRFVAAIVAANPTILIDAISTPVTVLKQPPAGYVVSEGKLPALYTFNSGEVITPDTLESDTRTLQLDVILLAKEGGDPTDQLDLLQLLVEQTIIATELLGSLCSRVQLERTSIALDRGHLIFGARTLSYSLELNVTANDPSL